MEAKEIRDILISWFVLSVAFMLLIEGISVYNPSSFSNISLDILVMYLFVVAVSFISHEMGHRQTARYYGFKANFEMWPFGVVFALVSPLISPPFLRFLFAAPGAVVIRQGGSFMGGRKKLNEIGLKISVSGIAINLILGFVLLVVYYTTGGIGVIVAGEDILQLASQINFFLAFFNLLPIPPLDGSKVFFYNRKVWTVAFAIAVIFTFL